MAIDPTQLAEDQEARQRADIAGAPTEFAKGPEQEGIQVAGVGDLFSLLGKLGPRVSKPTPPSGVVGTAPRVPTPQERGLMKAPELYSEAATKRELAPQILSPEGVQTFEERGLKAQRLVRKRQPTLWLMHNLLWLMKPQRQKQTQLMSTSKPRRH